MSKIENEQPQGLLLEVENRIQLEDQKCPSMFFFSWVYPLLNVIFVLKQIGRKKPLGQLDLLQIDKENSTSNSHTKFLTVLDGSSLMKTLFKAFTSQIFLVLLLYWVVTALQLCQPIITEYSQRFFMYQNPEDKPSINSMLSFAGIQLIYMLALSLIKPNQLFQSAMLSVKIQGTLQQEMLLKTLKFPISRSQHFSTGELINMLQVDITQASNYYNNAIILFTSPISLICSGLVFYVTIGNQALIPVLGAFVQFLIGMLFGYVYGIVQRKYMVAKDMRMKAVDESLIFAKQVKLNCLEEFFEERIQKQRASELNQLKNQVLMLIAIQLIQGIVGISVWEIFFFYAETVNFGIIILMMQNYTNILNLLASLPTQFKNFSMSNNSISRIDNYFKQNNCGKVEVVDQQSNVAIKLSNCTYDWKSNDHMAEDVIEEENNNLGKEQINIFSIMMNLQIEKGQFIAFVGNSASGKSTILRSILGEANYQSGDILINGTISVATQEPWIISGSIKKNITFMNTFDSVKYKKVIKICGLERDLQGFKYGDETVLGEKGDNLSGGQQKRINLARAVYNDADIYLLDDPMSALDIKVKYQIHHQCIMDYLKGKTRIIFTNSMANLQGCDRIYIVENGKIIKSGKFSELIGVGEDKQLSQKEYVDLQFEDKHYKRESLDKQDVRSSLIQQEDQEKGQVSRNVLNRIFSYIGRYWAIICSLSYFGIVLGCQLVGNGVMAQDGLSDSEYQALALVYYPIIQSPIIIVMVLLNSYFLIRGLITSRLLHSKVINSLLNASYTKFYNTILIGRLMNRLSKDIYNIDLLFPIEVQNVMLQLTSLLLPLLACFIYLNLAAMPLLLIFFGIIIYLTIIYYRCLREITRIEAVSKSPVFSFFQQIVRGMTYVRACLPFHKVIVSQQQNVDRDLGNQVNLYGFQYWYQSLAGSITNVFQGLLFIICFLFPGETQQMTNLVLQQMQTVSSLLLNTTISYGNIQMYMISFERCLHLANKIELEERQICLVTPQQDPMLEEAKESDVLLKLDNCTFQYRVNSKSVLSELSMDLHKGEKIGVVGRTGAGKSSIILALTSILEQTEGSIEVGGKNVNQYSISELRQKFAIIPQDPLIFMGTLKDNLDPLHQFSEARILEVAKECELFEMQSFRQLGLTSEIAISGSNLSSGEKQLLNIARCILEDKKIVLVDEATANIDQNSEELVKKVFEKCFQSAAMLTIAHKVTTIMNSDRIMVLNDGKITEFDHPAKLLANPDSEFKLIIDLIQQSEQL